MAVALSLLGQLKLYPVSSLLLDLQNPRFRNSVDAERAALREHLATERDKLVALARDIATQGAVNPTDLPVVVREGEHFVVIEGNRRLAALKLLLQPELADEDAPTFKRLSSDGAIPGDVVCYVAETRDAARHWIDLRHTGENGGAGVVPWEAWQTNNFRRRPGSHADRASRFCDAVEAEYADDANLLANVETVRYNRLTTLGRLVADPRVREEIGFSFEDGRVVFEFPKEAMQKGIARIFQDLAGEIGVSQIKNKEQRQRYIDDMREDLPPKTTRLGKPRPAGSVQDSVTPPPPSLSRTQSAPRRRRLQERVIFQGLDLRYVEPSTSILLRQAHHIDIDTSPGVAGIMVRVILELVVAEAGSRFPKPLPDRMPLQKKLRRVLLHLDPNCEHPMQRDKGLEMAWVRSQDSAGGVDVQMMNAFVHNVTGNAAPSEVRTLSNTYRVVLERLDTYLGGIH